jgi:hypothetical protein
MFLFIRCADYQRVKRMARIFQTATRSSMPRRCWRRESKVAEAAYTLSVVRRETTCVGQEREQVGSDKSPTQRRAVQRISHAFAWSPQRLKSIFDPPTARASGVHRKIAPNKNAPRLSARGVS